MTRVFGWLESCILNFWILTYGCQEFVERIATKLVNYSHLVDLKTANFEPFKQIWNKLVTWMKKYHNLFPVYNTLFHSTFLIEFPTMLIFSMHWNVFCVYLCILSLLNYIKIIVDHFYVEFYHRSQIIGRKLYIDFT